MNFLEIYFDTTPDAIPLDGTGFGDGQLIFRGAFSVVNSEVDSISNTPVPLDSLFPDNLEPLVPDPPIGNTVQTISTLAAVQFESDVVDVDPTFFKDPLGLLRTGVDFAGGGTAFSTVNPSQAFVTMPNPDADLSDGAGPNPDLQAFPLTTDTPGVGIGAVNGDTLPGSPVGGQQGGPDFILQYDSSTPFLVDQPAIHVEKAINAVDPLSPTVAEDADNPTGPALAPGTPVVWTYLVTAEDELGKPSDTPIEIVSLVDDFGTPGVLGDDFNPLPVLAGLFNVGDTNMNGLLDPQTLTSPGETWLYTSEGEVAYNVVAGQYKNIAKVTGNPVDETGVDLPGAPDVMDDDPNHHIGIDAKITIAPDDTNEVGDDHTFTTIVWVDDGTGSDVDGEMGTFDRWEGADVTVSLANFHGAVANPAGPFMGATDVNGEYDVTFTSQTAGQVVGTATAEIMIGGAVLIVSTDGLGDNSGPATKTFVDAKIAITPDDTNEVGDDHTFTTVFWVDDGTGTDLDGEMGTFDRWEAADVTVSLANSHGAVANPAGPFMGATDVNGEYDVTFTSLTAGQVVGNATGSVEIDGVLLTRSTDGLGNNSGPATKTFVDAKITIAPDDTNEVGDDHTFTTIFWVDDGTGTDLDGEMGTFDRWEAADVTVSLANSHGAVANPAGPFMGATDVNGEYDVTFTSLTAGQVVGNATGSVEIDGVLLTRSTDGLGNNSGPATKTFVDAKITIAPDDTNEVGDDHTFTTVFWVDDGTGTDLDGEMGTFDRWEAADVTVSLANSHGAVANPAGPFMGATDAAGEYDVTFTSLTAGQVVGNATGSVEIDGVLLTRSTDGLGNNSGPATKTFVDAKITIAPDDTNEVGDDHTFTTVFWVDDGTGTDLDGEMGTFDRWEAADVTVSLANFHGAVANPAGPFMGATDVNGEYDVTFTSLTAGQVVGNATGSVEIDGVLLTPLHRRLGEQQWPCHEDLCGCQDHDRPG